MRLPLEFNNVRATYFIGEQSNEEKRRESVLPERFVSVSSPSDAPIVSPELNSVSQPKMEGQSRNG
jgi:hypothetical protein